MTPPELASNCSANSLWPIRDRLHLWTCTTARNHAVLGHFLEYYAAHGVKVEQNARVVVHRDYAPADALRHVQHVLEGAGVRHIEWLSSVNSIVLEGLKLKRLNAFIRDELPADGWLIFADVDEFFSYPCDTLSQLARARPSVREAACAFMQDRVHSDMRSLPRVRLDRPIQQQFPRCAKLRGLTRTPINGCERCEHTHQTSRLPFCSPSPPVHAAAATQ